MKDKTYLTSEEVKKGNKYFFVDTDFKYIKVPKPIIEERTVYRVISSGFSTKEKGDQYEAIQHMAFETKQLATEQAIKDLKEYKLYINQEIDNLLASLDKPLTDEESENMKKLTKQEQKDEAYEAYRAKYKKIEGQKYQAWEAYDAIRSSAVIACEAIQDSAWEAYNARCKEIDAQKTDDIIEVDGKRYKLIEE